MPVLSSDGSGVNVTSQAGLGERSRPCQVAPAQAASTPWTIAGQRFQASGPAHARAQSGTSIGAGNRTSPDGSSAAMWCRSSAAWARVLAGMAPPLLSPVWSAQGAAPAPSVGVVLGGDL